MSNFELHTIKEYHIKEARNPEIRNLTFLVSEHEISAITTEKNNEDSLIVSAAFSNSSNSELLNEKFVRFISNYRIKNNNYTGKTGIIILNRLFCVCPKAYNGDQLKEMLAFNTGIQKIEQVNKYIIRDEICFAFSYPTDFAQLIEKEFPNSEIIHAGAYSVNLFLSLPQFSETSALVIIHKQLVEICIKNKNTLLLYNLFEWNTSEDLLYYILFSMEQFGLKPASDEIQIAGNFPVSDPIFDTLKKYLGKLLFFNGKHISKGNEPLPGHYHFHLLNKHLCAL